MKKILSFPLCLCLALCCALLSACETVNPPDDGTDPIQLSKYVQQTEIPTLEITAQQAIDSKYDYVPASFTMTSESGVYDFQADGEIRLRGNYTMTHDKKPYRIKFSQKQSPIGMDSSKSWYLLAETTDFSLMRNYLGYTYADDILDYSLRARYVQVTVNGEYQGLYVMTDKKGEGEDRIPIQLTDNANTGWLLEIDNRAIGGDNPENEEAYEYCRNEGIVFGVNAFYVDFAGDLQACVISEPGEPTAVQFQAIEQYMTALGSSLYGEDYTSYLDLDSMVRYYIVKELWHDTDVGSVFLYRENAASKAKMGPVWDLDLTLGISKIVSEGKTNSYDEWYYRDINCIIRPASRSAAFQSALRSNWNALYSAETADLLEGIDQVTAFLSEAQQLNFSRWNTIGQGIYIDGKINKTHFMSDDYLSMTAWEQHAAAVKRFLTERVKWINQQLNS